MISQSVKTLLAKLYYRDRQAFDEKISKMGIPFEDVSGEINNEAQRISLLKKISEMPREHISSGKHVSFINDINDAWTLVLIDGDNLSNGEICAVDRRYHNTVMKVFVNNKRRYEELSKILSKYHSIKVEYVQFENKGDQAVDNRIKTLLGQEVQNYFYQMIYIVSRDKGFDKSIEKYRKKHNWNEIKLRRCETIPFNVLY